MVNKIIKENIYEIERKLDHVFKEAIIIANNFSSFSISYSGFKKVKWIPTKKRKYYIYTLIH